MKYKLSYITKKLVVACSISHPNSQTILFKKGDWFAARVLNNGHMLGPQAVAVKLRDGYVFLGLKIALTVDCWTITNGLVSDTVLDFSRMVNDHSVMAFR